MNANPPVSDLPAKQIPPCGILSGREGSCIVLSMRHLGDAVIGSGVINSLQRLNPRMEIDVLGQPQLQEVLRTFTSFREFIGISVPVFGHHRKGIPVLGEALRRIQMVRKRRYDFCINLIGDVRENSIGIVTGAKWNIAPVWEHGHLFKRKITDTGALWLTNCGIFIPSTYANFYESMQYLTKQLGLPGLEWRELSSRRQGPKDRTTVAIHPGASHASRHWPEGRWRALINELYGRGYKVKVLGAPRERTTLLASFSTEIASHKVEVITEEIPGFVSCLAMADALVGMDSFSVHAAYALGVPVVVLNGSADPSILTPPGGMVATAGHLCKRFPCYYSYPCRQTPGEYICVRGIEVGLVLDALKVALERCHVVQAAQGRVD